MTRNTTVLAGLCAFIISMMTVPQASAEKLEITSPNFIFVGDVREKDGLKLVKDLEIYRATVLALAGISDNTEIRPVKIYGVRSMSEIKDFTNRSGIAGVYTLSDDFPVFVMLTDGGFDRNDFSRHIALHEYAHHIIGSYTEEYFPRWYNEGFAEYISAFDVEGDIVSIGMPRSRFGEALKNQNWLDIDTVLNSVTRYPDWGGSRRVQRFRVSMFYGLSWISVHYIQNTPELSSRLGEYIALINQGTDPAEAFEQGFGITQDEFDDRLRDYWRADRFPSVQFRYTEEIFKDAIDVRELDDKEFDLAMLDGERIFYPGGEDRARDRRGIEREIDRHEDRHGYHPAIARARMTLALANDDHDQAVTHAKAALAAFPEATDAHLIAGDAYYHRYADTEEPDIADLDFVRLHFAEVLRADPTNPTANSHYISSFAYDGTPPDALALDAVNFLASYRRNPSYWGTHLKIGEVLLMADQPDRACDHISKVALWVRQDAERAAEENDGDDDGDEDEIKTVSTEKPIDRLTRLLETPDFSCPQAE